MNHRPTARLRAPKTVIAINRDQFTLYFYRLGKDYKYHRLKYKIAIGKIGDATPGGAYFVDAKTRKPDWLIPEHPDYASETWGKIVPYESEYNPFAGGFISLSGGEGVGIHGTKKDPQLGTRASHGCIRVGVEDLLEIYKKTRLGTPVLVT